MWWVQLSRWVKDQAKLSLGRLGYIIYIYISLFCGPCRSSVPQIRHHCFQMFRAEAAIRIMHPFLKGATGCD